MLPKLSLRFRSKRFLFFIALVALLLSCNRPPSPPRISTQFNWKSTDAIAQAPYILPKCFDASESQDLKIQISAVGTDGSKSSACQISQGGENTEFTMRWSDARAASKITQVAEVNVKAANVYSDIAEDRARLKKAFNAFRQSLFAMQENETNNCLKAGDARIISQRVANALPLRLDEVLAYHYGFDSSNRVIDLQAGMRLRVEQGAYQFIDPDDNPSEAYVGRGTSYIHITHRSKHTLAFDSYLGSLAAIEVSAYQGELGRTRMISGAMGLAAVGVSRRYARLVYPSQYPGVNNTSAVESEDELPMRVGLLLANTAADLTAATQMYLDNSACAANESNSVMCFYFSGRSFVIPELLVKIQGTEKYVPVGTTLRDAFNRYTVTSDRQIGNPGMGGFIPKLKRWVQPTLCQSNANYERMSILFEDHSPITASTLSQWDMPFLKGDELWW